MQILYTLQYHRNCRIENFELNSKTGIPPLAYEAKRCFSLAIKNNIFEQCKCIPSQYPYQEKTYDFCYNMSSSTENCFFRLKDQSKQCQKQCQIIRVTKQSFQEYSHSKDSTISITLSKFDITRTQYKNCLLYTSPSPRD